MKARCLLEPANMRRVAFLFPGRLDTLTGGYIYDRHIVDGLRTLGWTVDTHSLDTSFPNPTAEALRDADRLMASLPAPSLIVIDGLALGALAEILHSRSNPHHVVALVHHPLALETGLDAVTAQHLFEIERDALRHARSVVVTSRWTAQALDEYGVPGDRVRVIEPGTTRGLMRSGPAAHPHRLLCVASLTPRKGHLVLLEALAELASSDWHLACAGSLSMDPDCASAVQARIDALGLDARIELLGELTPAALAERYARADSFVLASFMEGYGMALTEAIAAGLPVVSTTAGAIPHVLPAAASRLVPAGDSHALAGALAEVITGGPTWQGLAKAAANATLPSWDEAVQRFAALLAQAAAQ